ETVPLRLDSGIARDNASQGHLFLFYVVETFPVEVEVHSRSSATQWVLIAVELRGSIGSCAGKQPDQVLAERQPEQRAGGAVDRKVEAGYGPINRDPRG